MIHLLRTMIYTGKSKWKEFMNDLKFIPELQTTESSQPASNIEEDEKVKALDERQP